MSKLASVAELPAFIVEDSSSTLKPNLICPRSPERRACVPGPQLRKIVTECASASFRFSPFVTKQFVRSFVRFATVTALARTNGAAKLLVAKNGHR